MKSIFSHIGAARNCQSKHISVFFILMMRLGNAYTLIVSKKFKKRLKKLLSFIDFIAYLSVLMSMQNSAQHSQLKT